MTHFRSGPIWIGVFALLASPLTASESPTTGKQIYQTRCAECHGANGEGVEDYYPDPLHGGRSLEELIEIINDTMPEDDPERCEGDCAKTVAGYIYQTFYTEAARAQNRPARIALSRLTVRQYVNAAADLIGSFTGQGTLSADRGLKGRYFAARNFGGDKKVLQRLDPRIAFDFGGSSPAPDKIDSGEFSIRWQGSLIAEDTGEYEFCLDTENGARLWVNDNRDPLIDAWVKSGDETRHTQSVRLLGGRVYPIRVDYFKFKGKAASISLQWRPPHRAREIIPKRNLSPDWSPPTLVVTTPFPPDDSSEGYERGTSVSKSWDEATTYAAIEIANHVVGNLSSLARCKDDDPDRESRLRQFCYRLAERAFRRPLTDEQRGFFVDAHFEGNGDLPSAVKRSVMLVLKSPRFLYLGIGGRSPDDYDVASRLSFGLWDSLPDPPRLKAAEQRKLQTVEQVAEQARRMLADRRTRSKLRYFFHQWLRVDRAYDISRDRELFPEFNDATVSDLLASLDLFVDDVVWSPTSDFRQLLLSNHLFVNSRLAKFYGIEGVADERFRKVSLDPSIQAGILTHPYLMTGFAYHKSSSPIHRGVFIIRSLLGRALKPPPIAVAPLDEGLDPGLTTRQRVALQTRPAACHTCHRMINPLGFSLEHYDAVGRYRATEKQKPIDASGSYRPVSGDVVRFDGGRQLAELLAQSDEVHRCFVQQLFHHVVKQPVDAYGPNRLEHLAGAFVRADFNIQQLVVEIMKVSALGRAQP